ncbi:metallophosphoesterase [Streptomyces phage TunaTartare]|uniref:Metallophosphoesterase n=1 Tax=Streptomyces phage TunaTartare TaxID=2848887 RepID=A0A8F2E6T1_9CAUD|nr:metallo-phosphoesterase [Streptomyces phage TunaTartare]QWT30037.1 metallophosphoesterase [Streptomyces phage TunaTartare]
MIKIKIMVLGDVHGQTQWLKNVIKKAHRMGVDRILQVGDFGIWTHEAEGHRFLDAVNEELRRVGMKLYFVGGNHENWDHLNWWEKNNAKSSRGHTYVRSHILYTGRVHRWVWGEKGSEKVFQAVGGAVSVDKRTRTVGKTLWLDEEIPERVVYGLEKANRQCDYLFTHDAPSCVPLSNLKPDLDSARHRGYMDRIGRATRPNLWFHGHYHKYMEYSFMHQQGYAFVYGIDRDFQFYSYVILDTETDNVETATGKVIEHGN